MKEFNNIIGYESIKQELYRICDMVKNRAAYERLGANLPRGVMLYGAPGLGKSMMATALMEACGASSFTLRRSSPDGDFLHEIRHCFERAAACGFATVLLDDIDKFAADADSEQEFAAVQAAIDSVKDQNVLVIATANHIQRLPDSLFRAGRFDRIIEVPRPEGADSLAIIRYYMESKAFVKNVNYDDVAKMLCGKSCADLETVINEAAIYAAYERCEAIGMEHLVRATLRKMYGVQGVQGMMTPAEREMVACHEAGHALIAEVLEPGSVGMVSVSASGTGSMGGFTLRCRRTARRAYRILCCLGGKAACEMRYGYVAGGTQSDLHDALNDINDSIRIIGSVGVGAMDLSGRFPGAEQGLGLSEAAVQSELSRYLFKAKEIIAQNRELLDALTRELLEKDTILASDIARVRAGCTVVPVAVG
jgi:cell division protease FtsH